MAGKHRRGKAEKAETSLGDVGDSVEAQITKAREAVEKSRYQTAELHSNWRLYLFRLSLMVVLVTIHQWQTPIGQCLKDIKSYNRSLDENSPFHFSGYDAIYYSINDTLCEFLGVIMGVLLSLCLNQFYQESLVIVTTPTGTSGRDTFFTNKLYMVATALVPAVLNFYFHRTRNSKTCLEHSNVILTNVMWERDIMDGDSFSSQVRGFPVVVVFHTIATACCWFMNFQQSQSNRNVLLIEKLKKDLLEARKENDSAKKAASESNSKTSGKKNA